MTVIVIRKRLLIIIAAIAVMIIIIISLFLNSNVLNTLETTNIPSTTKVIVIDPGHGGVDPGAIGRDKTLEKDINLSIGNYLREYLEQSGSIVIMTRETDIGLYDNSGSIRNKKNQDLKRRKDLVKASKADVFLTIHLNSFQQQQYYGAQTFYPKGSQESKKLAEIVQEELREILDAENKRVALPKSDMYLIKELVTPTVLVECGFLSNPQELRKLKDPKYQRKIAWGIYVGLQKYLSTGE